jgi:hypothetical protein
MKHMQNIQLRGGPFDGATLPGVEAIALRTEIGVHWYVYTGAPPEAEDGHDGILDHHADETPERGVTAFDGPGLTANCLRLHHASIAHKLDELRESLAAESEARP